MAAPTTHVPLFSVSLVWAIGIILGLMLPPDFLFSARLGFSALGLIWLMSLWGRCPPLRLTLFFMLVALGGMIHTAARRCTVAGDDLRQLPATKLDSSTQWRGVILQEPNVTTTSAHRHGLLLEHATFLLRVAAWRSAPGVPFSHVIDQAWYTANGLMQVSFGGKVAPLQIGDCVEFAAAAQPFTAPLVPGELDQSALYARQDVYYHAEISPLSWRIVQPDTGDWWRSFSYAARDWTYARLQWGLEDDPRTANVLAGMLIGYRQEIPLDIEDDFRRTGTLHVFAVSGQNVAELAVVGLLGLRLLGLVRWRWAWLLAPIVLAYCLLTGTQASAVRATLMALGLLAAWRLERPILPLGLWSISLIGMLVWDPLLILDPGTQLSFAVVLALILLGPTLGRILHRPFQPDPFLPRRFLTRAERWEEKFWHYSAYLLGSSLAATLVSEPIAAVEFHQITPISVVANLIVVPLAGLITVVGTLSIALSLISHLLAVWMNNANWLFTRILIAIVAFFAHQPGAALNVPDPRVKSSATTERLTIFPLQDSAALLLRAPGQAWLFNTGRESEARYITARLLQYEGINQLQGLVLMQISGPDNGGAEVIVQHFHPQRILLPVLPTRSPVERKLPEIVAGKESETETWQTGDVQSITPQVQIEVLSPDPDSSATKAADRGLVLLFHVGAQNLIWAGKISHETRSLLQTRYPKLRAPILISSGGTTPLPSELRWLEHLQTQVWLTMPRSFYLPPMPDAPNFPPGLLLWPLNERGAVEIQVNSNNLSIYPP